ncbi:MAG: CvpA family protein [Bryobacterales bacterium]|nr:CvpA family protein [Bryobacteraceae bacterium]MDW8354177.1 CvpA family protein [Bryobacterales bacterium]
MNWLDIALAALLTLSVIGGCFKGFAKVGIGFLATIAGLLGGLWFYGVAGSFLLPYVSHRGFANFVGFLLVFALITALGGVAGFLLGILFKWTGLSWLDRLLGGVFGLLRAGVAATALVLALMAFTPKPPPRAVVHSRLAPYVVDAARLCAGLAPYEVKQAVRENYIKVREAWEDAVRKYRRQQPPEETI